MHILRAITFLAAGFIASAAAHAETVRGNGTIRTESRNVAGFSGVSLGVPAKVEVRIGPQESVTVEADENLLPLIATSVERDSLHIKPVRRNLVLESRSIRVVVQAREIRELEIGGSGTIHAHAIRGSRLEINIGGAGAVELARLDTCHLGVTIGGSGDIKLAGTALKLVADIAGSGDIQAPGLVVEEADVNIAGTGSANLGVRKRLDVTVAGSGKVSYFGEPQVRRTLIGAGVIRRLGPLPQ